MTKPQGTGSHVSRSEEQSGGNANGTPHIHWVDMGRRAKGLLAEMPESIEVGMKKNPYAVVTVAATAGLGVGILLGSRVLRAVLASTVSYVVAEAARSYLRDRLARTGEGTTAPSRS